MRKKNRNNSKVIFCTNNKDIRVGMYLQYCNILLSNVSLTTFVFF